MGAPGDDTSLMTREATYNNGLLLALLLLSSFSRLLAAPLTAASNVSRRYQRPLAVFQSATSGEILFIRRRNACSLEAGTLGANCTQGHNWLLGGRL